MTEEGLMVLRSYPLFAFGTLQDAEVFELVSGGIPLSLVPREAGWLAGQSIVGAEDRLYPVLQQAAEAWAPGTLFHDLSAEVLDRLAWFEWPEFRPEPQEIATTSTTRTCACFIPAQKPSATAQSWSLETWQKNKKRHWLSFAELCMAFYGVCTSEELDLHWEDILARMNGHPRDLPEHIEARCEEISGIDS
ncbi:gamma-glutamylcyclotransferase family protein [Fodinicurvata halophila]|uniref:Gamma-glutamylcyclotransferase family protein n=1 Tax=Fodinicurvata halophila TaxID=1419723 RepID=A0ABV8UPD1_9PROT